MQDNPYRPPRAVLEPKLTSERLGGFPFLLVVRWIVAASVVVYGTYRSIDSISGWNWLADRAIIHSSYNPFVRLTADACILLTGVLLFRRSKLVFVPLLAHSAIFAWLVFGFGPVRRIPGPVFVVWAAQLALLGFCSWLFIRQHLR